MVPEIIRESLKTHPWSFKRWKSLALRGLTPKNIDNIHSIYSVCKACVKHVFTLGTFDKFCVFQITYHNISVKNT